MSLIWHSRLSYFLKSITILGICIFVGAPLLCQPGKDLKNEIDSLRNSYLTNNNDTLRLNALTLLGQRLRYVNIDSSKYYLRKAIRLHKEKKVNIGSLAFAYNIIGNIYKLEPNVDSARHYYEEAYQFLSKENNDRAFLAIIPPYGSFLTSHNEVERGINMLQEGISLAKEKDKFASLSFLYEYLGEVFQNNLKDNNRAKNYYTKGLEAIEKIKLVDEKNYNRLNARLSLNLSSIYLIENNIPTALEYAKSTVAYGTKEKMYHLVVDAYNNLCKGYLARSQYKSAKKYNQLAGELNQKINDTYANIQIEILKQALFLKTKDYLSCIKEGKSTLNKFESYLENDNKAKIFEYLCECHALSGNTQEVIKNKDSLLYYQRKTLDIKQNELLARLDNEYQVKEKEAENELLKIRQDASLRQLRTQRFAALGLGIALLFAIAWALAFYQANRQRKRHNAILELKVAERTEELQKANSNLEQANYELRTFNYIASHDIKEPIRNIGNFVGLIKSQLPDDIVKDLGLYFETIQKSSKQLYNLVEDFAKYIDFSKNEEMPKAEVDLNNIVDGIIANVSLIGKYPHGKIINHGLPTIFSNQSANYVILKNLLENGLKYNDSEVPKVELSYHSTPSFHLICIQDNGIGIKEDYFNNIFKMFKRLHGKNQYEGTGIGLALVDLLTKKLNGKIEMESELKKGSLFKLYLPK